MTTTTKPVQGVLVESDEDLAFQLADLVPVASKILDAAASYIARVGKKFSDEKTPLTHQQITVLSQSCDLAQQVVKLGAEINLMVRKPQEWLLKSIAADIAAENTAEDVPIIDDDNQVIDDETTEEDA